MSRYDDTMTDKERRHYVEILKRFHNRKLGGKHLKAWSNDWWAIIRGPAVRNDHVLDDSLTLAGMRLIGVRKDAVRGKQVNAKMIAKIQKDARSGTRESHGWTAKQWATFLKCSAPSVVATETWKCLREERETLPKDCKYIENMLNSFRRQLEDAVVACGRTLTIDDSADQPIATPSRTVASWLIG